MENNTPIKISDLKVKELKLKLKERNLELTGNKCELRTRLKNALNSSYLVDNDGIQDQENSPEKNSPNQRKKLKYIHTYQGKVGVLEQRISYLEKLVMQLNKKNKKMCEEFKSLLKQQRQIQLVNNKDLAVVTKNNKEDNISEQPTVQLKLKSTTDATKKVINNNSTNKTMQVNNKCGDSN